MKQWLIAGLIATGLSANAGPANSYPNNESLKPTKEFMDKAQVEYTRYCSACHAKDGTGAEGPALKGSVIATGPMGGTIHIVITGGPHTKMPMWGLTELSDDILAEVLTYVRNAWGNDDKQANGKHAGGVITPELVKTYREALPNKNIKRNIRT